MVARAKAAKGRLRFGSKRSTAWMRPTRATCTRSSRDSRSWPGKRRASEKRQVDEDGARNSRPKARVNGRQGEGARGACGRPPHRDAPPVSPGRPTSVVASWHSPSRVLPSWVSECWGWLADAYARDGSGDRQPLDLRGALEEGEDLGVAVPTLEWVVAHVAVAAEDLDGLVGDPDGVLARVELRHRAFSGFEALAGAGHPAGSPHEQPGRVGAHLHVGQREGDRLVLDDRSAELLAVLGVVERVLVGGAGDADGLCAHGGREASKTAIAGCTRACAFAGAGQALVELLLAAEQASARHPAVVEDHLGGVRNGVWRGQRSNKGTAIVGEGDERSP